MDRGRRPVRAGAEPDGADVGARNRGVCMRSVAQVVGWVVALLVAGFVFLGLLTPNVNRRTPMAQIRICRAALVSWHGGLSPASGTSPVLATVPPPCPDGGSFYLVRPDEPACSVHGPQSGYDARIQAAEQQYYAWPARLRRWLDDIRGDYH